MEKTKSEKIALREIGLSAAKDAGKEALRGAAVYAAVNLAQVSKSVAAASISGVFRVAEQLEQFRAGETSSVECAEAVADVLNTAGVFLYQIVNAYTKIAMESLPQYRPEAAAV